jgi:cytochrome c556
MSNIVSGIPRIVTILSLFICGVLLACCSSETAESEQSANNQNAVQKAKEDVPELADAMGQLQTYTHKYALAVEAENHELATFYFHEVRASADGIKENIPGYEGYDIERFMRLFLDPTIEPVETALADRNWEEVRQRTIELIDACNSCHNATSHGFVKITPGFDNNPFNQDFSDPE